MKTLAKNQNVRSSKWRPRIVSRKSYSDSRSHSRKFCALPGTALIRRVATCAKTMSAIATIQVTNMEFEIGKPNGRAMSTALWGSADMLCPSTARAMPRRRCSRRLRRVP